MRRTARSSHRARSASSRGTRCCSCFPPWADADAKPPQFVRPIASTRGILSGVSTSPLERDPSQASAMSGNLFDLLRSRVRAPEKPLLELADGRQLNYADALAWSGRIANVLVLRGVEPGDRVAVQV